MTNQPLKSHEAMNLHNKETIPDTSKRKIPEPGLQPVFLTDWELVADKSVKVADKIKKVADKNLNSGR